MLFNYAGVGKSRRDPDVWHRAALAGVDGMLTDYPLECRSVWRVARRSGSDSPLIDPRGVWVETPWGRPVIDRGGGNLGSYGGRQPLYLLAVRQTLLLLRGTRPSICRWWA